MKEQMLTLLLLGHKVNNIWYIGREITRAHKA